MKIYISILAASLIALAGCVSKNQSEINRIQTSILREQQIILEYGRNSEAQNEVTDRYLREQFAKLKELQ